MQQATNAILRGGTIMTPSVSAKTIAEQLAEKINAKLNYTPVEKLEEERQAAEQAETVKRYEEELEINDFPQVSSTHSLPSKRCPLSCGGLGVFLCQVTASCSLDPSHPARRWKFSRHLFIFIYSLFVEHDVCVFCCISFCFSI